MEDSLDKQYRNYFYLLIATATILRLLIIGLSLLTPQEAYYWNYGRHPDWSYFDHPAAASLIIKAGTILFGDNSFGIRFFGVITSSILAAISFFFVRYLFNARVAFYSVLVLSVTWIFAIGAVITTPDNPLFLFWILNIIFIYFAYKCDSLSFYLLWGVSLGLGFCSKYTMGFVIPSALLFLLLTGKLREVRTWFYFTAGLVTGVIFSFPVIYWNYLHDWASFAFQTTRRASEMSSFRFDMFFGFIGSQFGTITPFIFPFVIFAIYLTGKKSFGEGNNRFKLLFSYAAPIILLFTLASLRGWVKMNWPTPGFFTGIIAMCALFENRIKPKFHWMNRRWRYYAIFAVFFAIIASGITYIHSFFPILPMGKADTMTGWDDLGEVSGYYTIWHIPETPDNIIGYEYKIASEAAFYTFGQPDTKSDNFVGEHGLSYRFWSDPEDYMGEDFILAYDSRYRYHPEDKLLKYFEYYLSERPLRIFGVGGEQFSFHFIRCYGYKGVNN